jgi:hypothetical protein
MSSTKITYVKEHDCLLLTYGEIELRTPDDVEVLGEDLTHKLAGFHRRMDLVINFGGLVVKSAAAASFAELRKLLVERYLLGTYRFGGTAAMRTAVHTSAVITNTPSRLFETYEQAIEALLRDRAAATPPSSRPAR